MKGLIDIQGPVQPPGLGSTAKLRVMSPLALALFPSGAPDHSTSYVCSASARTGNDDQHIKATVASSGAGVSFMVALLPKTAASDQANSERIEAGAPFC